MKYCHVDSVLVPNSHLLPLIFSIFSSFYGNPIGCLKVFHCYLNPFTRPEWPATDKNMNSLSENLVLKTSKKKKKGLGSHIDVLTHTESSFRLRGGLSSPF